MDRIEIKEEDIDVFLKEDVGTSVEFMKQLKQQILSDYEIVNRLEKILWMTKECDRGSERCKYCYLSQELQKILGEENGT